MIEEWRAVEGTLGRFAGRVEAALFGDEGADGDLSAVPALLDQARALGLVADPDPEAPGYELGVWGRACLEEGPALSLLTLAALGEACAGFATAVHAQGLGCLTLDGQVALPSATVLATVFMPLYGVPLSSRTAVVGSGLSVSEKGGRRRLHGESYFLLAAAEPAQLVCFARQERARGGGREWLTLLVPVDAPGLALRPAGRRTGLRAACQYHLSCDGAPLADEWVLSRGEPARRLLARVLACDWLGQAAMALGVARRALGEARAYAAQRYQGGRMIEAHAAVQLLQGGAAYDVGLLEAVVYRHAGEALRGEEDPAVWLRRALVARLAVVEHAHRAVTDCLQTLGGYGYMEDYGMEKRLRDVSTLKSLHGAPDQLKLLLNELAVTG